MQISSGCASRDRDKCAPHNRIVRIPWGEKTWSCRLIRAGNSKRATILSGEIRGCWIVREKSSHWSMLAWKKKLGRRSFRQTNPGNSMQIIWGHRWHTKIWGHRWTEMLGSVCTGIFALLFIPQLHPFRLIVPIFFSIHIFICLIQPIENGVTVCDPLELLVYGRPWALQRHPRKTANLFRYENPQIATDARSNRTCVTQWMLENM